MEKPLQNTPAFDAARFQEQTQGWPRGHRTILEWSTGAGAHCFVYPAGDRAAGILLTHAVEAATHDERWADFLEFEFIPKVVQALQESGLTPEVVCVDLRPLVVQRARRRTIEAAARAKAGAAAH